MTLTFEELRDSCSSRKDIEHETCRQALAHCNERIKNNNDVGLRWLLYTVPGSLPGRPLMPVGKISLYLSDRLAKAGIQTRPVGDSMLFIDWSAPLPGRSPRHKTSSREKPADDEETSSVLRRRLLNFRRRAAGWTIK